MTKMITSGFIEVRYMDNYEFLKRASEMGFDTESGDGYYNVLNEDDDIIVCINYCDWYWFQISRNGLLGLSKEEEFNLMSLIIEYLSFEKEAK